MFLIIDICFICSSFFNVVFVDKAYLSASKDHYGEGTEQVHMIIKHCKSARDVSKYNYNEQEVISLGIPNLGLLKSMNKMEL